MNQESYRISPEERKEAESMMSPSMKRMSSQREDAFINIRYKELIGRCDLSTEVTPEGQSKIFGKIDGHGVEFIYHDTNSVSGTIDGEEVNPVLAKRLWERYIDIAILQRGDKDGKEGGDKNADMTALDLLG